MASLGPPPMDAMPPAGVSPARGPSGTSILDSLLAVRHGLLQSATTRNQWGEMRRWLGLAVGIVA